METIHNSRFLVVVMVMVKVKVLQRREQVEMNVRGLFLQETHPANQRIDYVTVPTFLLKNVNDLQRHLGQGDPRCISGSRNTIGVAL